MTVFVVPDIHGNHDALESLLRSEGLINEAGERLLPDVTVVQLGDLANCVRGSAEDDLACLARVGTWIDVMLVGNHEYPYFSDRGRFNGFNYDEHVAEWMEELNISGELLPAYEAHDVLLTHAGLTAARVEKLRDTPASFVAKWLNERWARDPEDPVFSDVGVLRGGRHEEGGVLWSDCDEPKLDTVNQLFGHTPGDRTRHGLTWHCIDLGVDTRRHAGTMIAGAWVRESGIDFVTASIEKREVVA